MRKFATPVLVLLAGIAIEIWLTVVGMSNAFLGGLRLPLSARDLIDNWDYFGVLFGAPVLATILVVLAFKLWRKRAPE